MKSGDKFRKFITKRVIVQDNSVFICNFVCYFPFLCGHQPLPLHLRYSRGPDWSVSSPGSCICNLLTWQWSSSSHLNRQFSFPLHSSSFLMQRSSWQSNSSSGAHPSAIVWLLYYILSLSLCVKQRNKYEWINCKKQTRYDRFYEKPRVSLCRKKA